MAISATELACARSCTPKPRDAWMHRGGFCLSQAAGRDANPIRYYSQMKQLSNDAVNWVEVGEEGAGQRIDNFLLGLLKGVPKSHVYRILRSGEVRLNSRRVEATARLTPGDRLRVPPIRVAGARDDRARRV